MVPSLTVGIVSMIFQGAIGVKPHVRTARKEMPALLGADIATSPTQETIQSLLYLAGGAAQHAINLNQGVLEEMGWKKGTTIHHGNGDNDIDTAQIYTKQNGVCAIAFSATDEKTDELQQVQGAFAQKRLCGLKSVNKGYAEEMRQYMNLPTWKDGIAELANCSDVWAVGHSMGGAMASLFAFCANKQHKKFQGLPEVALMTTGAPEVSKDALYNRRPGMCFRGVRTSVFHEAKEPPSEFYINVAKLFNVVKPSKDIANIISEMQSLENNPTAFEVLKTRLRDHATPMFMMELMTTTNVTIHQAVLGTFSVPLNFFSASIPYDPVPTVWRPYGYVHPLVAYQPMPLPSLNLSPPPLVTCNSTTVPNLPNHDLLQGLLGTMLGKGFTNYTDFPNHDWCNLAPKFDDCAAKRNPTCKFISCNYADINPAVFANIAQS